MATTAEALSIALQHHQAGQLQAAEQIYRQILGVDPNHVDALHLLGVLAQQVGRCDVAVEYIGRVVELAPDYAEAHYNLASALQSQGALEQAVAHYRRALELNPAQPAACNNLGNVWKDLGNPAEAIACYRRALALQPDYAEAHNNLGNAWLDQGNLDEACVCYRRAVELNPGFAAAHNNLGVVLKDHGRLDEALACYRRALEAKPDFAAAHGNLLCALQYQAGASRSSLAAAHAEYERLHAGPLRGAWRPHENSRDPQRRLRIGFVSPDFRRHPVGYFLIQVLENLDRSRCETVCYSDRRVKDDLTRRFQSTAAAWRDVFALNDAALAEQVRADGIDILFDLAGHTANNRLLTFARKPAPIQATWAGYVGATGLKAMDYVLADRWEIPFDVAVHGGEQPLLMPDGYVCYEPPRYAPAVSPLPALEQGGVTFGSFNTPAKINRLTIETWAQILRRLPRSRLTLKYLGMNEPAVAGRLAATFAELGIGPERLVLLGGSPHVELLAEYNRIDAALDPISYNGGLTTCEALWMGVPVITCPGETFASRHSLSHLSNVGLTETIAGNLDEYVELAVSLAADLPHLAALRAGLRARMAASPLCDGKRFAENFLALMREIWQRWLQQETCGAGESRGTP